MFEQFPYADMQQLNLDWMIKIAKDFLDQYTHIQQVITDGLDELDAKAAALQALLDEWYNTHSQDIQDQLAAALAELNADVVLRINEFGTAADTRAQQAIESIPSDYTALYTLVQYIKTNDLIQKNAYSVESFGEFLFQYLNATAAEQGYYGHDATAEVTASTSLYHFPPIPVQEGKSYYHYDCRNYFCKIIYADGSVDYFDASDTQTPGTITAQKNGIAYITTARPAQALFTNKTATGPLGYGLQTTPIMAALDAPVTASNYQTVLPDLNECIQNKMFILNFANGDTSIPANYPFDSYHGAESTISYFWSIMPSSRLDSLFCSQFIFTGSGEFLMRKSTAIGVFSPWIPYTTQRIITVAKDGTGDYTALISGIGNAIKQPGTKVIVKPGTYDLISEAGQAYFEQSTTHGVKLSNGIELIFMPGAVVNFNYAGNSTWTLEHVSPFFIESGDVVINGLELNASRCRYALHDEMAIYSNIKDGKHIYKNCRLKMDNTNNPIWSANQCIGGGLGLHTTIEIENCIFESIAAPNHSGIVSYHNNANTGAKSRITIKDSVFITGTFRFGYYGTSQEKTDILVNNCLMKDTPYASNETPSAPYQNATLYEWNNKIN